MKITLLSLSLFVVGCNARVDTRALEAAYAEETATAQQAQKTCAPASWICDDNPFDKPASCGCGTKVSCGDKLAGCAGTFCLYNDHGLFCSAK